MEKLQSIVAPYLNATALQGIINRTLPLQNLGWYRNRFTWGPQRDSLTFSTIVGATQRASLASVIDRDSASPVRSRPGLRKILGEIPAIKHYRFLKEEDARMIIQMGEVNAQNSGRLTEIFDLVYNDVKFVSDGCEDRIDDFVAQSLSKGYVEIDEQNNPDGIVQEGYIDTFIPELNKRVASANWGTAGTDIVKDIRDTVQVFKKIGISFDVMLIDELRLWDVLNNDSLKSFLKGYYNPGSNNTYALTLENINVALRANRLPAFEVVDINQMIEIDGIQTPYRPWETNNVTFVPSGNLGTIHNARPIEDIRPASNVTYSKVGKTLISKWSSNEPFREYTKAELNAFPGVEQINQVVILKTDAIAW